MNFICKLIFGIYVVIGINFTVWGAAFFAACGLTAGCLSAGMLAAVQARSANAVFIVIVQLGNCFPAAIPVLLVAERCLLVIRWRRGMIIRIFLAAILLANRTVSGFTTVCFPPGSIMSLRGNHRAVVYNSVAVPANGIARVALFCAGRLLFAACICAGGVKIVVMRVYLTVFNTASMAPCPFMAVCGR